MGIWRRKRKALCKLTLYDNCPIRENRRVATWSLHTHAICLRLLQFPFSWLLSLLVCPAHLSTFILAPHKIGSCVFHTCLYLCFFKICKGN